MTKEDQKRAVEQLEIIERVENLPDGEAYQILKNWNLETVRLGGMVMVTNKKTKIMRDANFEEQILHERKIKDIQKDVNNYWEHIESL